MSFITKKQHKILVEQVKYNFEIIEQLDKAIDSYSTKFNEYDTKISDLDTKVSSYDSRIEQMKTEVDNVREQYTTITNVDIPEIKNNVELLSQTVGSNYIEFFNHKSDSELKFNTIETNLTNLNNKIETNVTNITSLNTNKQDKLTAGSGITIENNVISSNGGSGGSSSVYLIVGSITMSDNNYYFYETYSTDSTLTVGEYSYTDLFNKLFKKNRILEIYNQSISGVFKKLFVQSSSCTRYSITGTLELNNSADKIVKTRINYINKI